MNSILSFYCSLVDRQFSSVVNFYSLRVQFSEYILELFLVSIPSWPSRSLAC